MIKPMLCKSCKEPFDDPAWNYEPKLDGERCIATVTIRSRRGYPGTGADQVHYADVTLQTRTGKDATARYPEVVEALRNQSHSMILDGEIVARNEKGVPDFQLLSLRSRLQNPDLIRNRRATVPVVYEVFDILEINGHDIRDVPLYGRNTYIHPNLRRDPALQILESRTGTGKALAAEEKARGGEGIVAKLRDSSYREGKRSPNWLKIKFTIDEDFVICGFTPGTGNRSDVFGALVLGERQSDGRLRWVGNVGTGFTRATLLDLYPRLCASTGRSNPFPANADAPRKALWTFPVLIAKITYANRTTDGHLRFPVFLGLRDD